MGCDLLKIHLQNTITSKHSFQLQVAKTSLFSSLPFSTQQQHQQHHQYHRLSFFFPKPKPKSKFLIIPQSVQCCISSPTPPTSKSEAILQAKTCLSTSLEKPLNNPKVVTLTGKLKKKLKQPRFRVEIPVVDDSPSSLSRLAFEVFSDIPININRKGKGSPLKISLVWPNHSLFTEATATESTTFVSQLPTNQLQHMGISSLTNSDSDTTSMLNSADVTVFLAPEASQLAVVKSTVTDILYPKPVVIFNPRWGFEEEGSFGDELSGFVGSFEVIYSFMGLEVRGILSKRKGVIFKCVRDGVLSGKRWTVLVEEEGGAGAGAGGLGEMKVVSMFKARPSIGEVENLLYNLMALNSPVTKSAKFFKDLVSNINTGKNFKESV